MVSQKFLTRKKRRTVAIKSNYLLISDIIAERHDGLVLFVMF